MDLFAQFSLSLGNVQLALQKHLLQKHAKSRDLSTLLRIRRQCLDFCHQFRAQTLCKLFRNCLGTGMVAKF